MREGGGEVRREGTEGGGGGGGETEGKGGHGRRRE